MPTIRDNFTGAAGDLTAHAADTGQAWSSASADPSHKPVLTGTGYARGASPTGGPFGIIAISARAAVANVRARCRFRAVSLLATGDIGVVVRGQNSSSSAPHHYQFRYSRAGATCQLFRANGDGSYDLLGTAALAPTAGTDHTLDLDVSGTGATVTLTPYVDGVAQTPILDTSASRIVAAGHVGMILNVSGDTTDSAGLHVDWFDDGAGPALYTLTPPSPASGVAGVASGNFTLTLDQAAVSTVTFTPSASDGTFSPPSPTITAGNTTTTFTYTPASAGVKTVTAADDAGMPDPAGVTYTASAATTPAVSPTTATLDQLATQQLTASNFTGGAVTWSRIAGTAATISAGGLVTGTAHGQATAQAATMRATGVADPTQTAEAVITVRAVSVAISPASATVAPGGTQQFAATVTGTTNTAVTWSKASGVGSINATSGLYAAGSAEGSAVVLATPAADPARAASAAVTVADAADAVLFLTELKLAAAAATTPTIVPRLRGSTNAITAPSGATATAVDAETRTDGVVYSAVIAYTTVPTGSRVVGLWTADGQQYRDNDPKPFDAVASSGTASADPYAATATIGDTPTPTVRSFAIESLVGAIVPGMRCVVDTDALRGPAPRVRAYADGLVILRSPLPQAPAEGDPVRFVAGN